MNWPQLPLLTSQHLLWSFDGHPFCKSRLAEQPLILRETLLKYSLIMGPIFQDSRYRNGHPTMCISCYTFPTNPKHQAWLRKWMFSLNDGLSSSIIRLKDVHLFCLVLYTTVGQITSTEDVNPKNTKPIPTCAVCKSGKVWIHYPNYPQQTGFWAACLFRFRKTYAVQISNWK